MKIALWVAFCLIFSCCALVLIHNARPDLFDFGIMGVVLFFSVYTLPFTLGAIMYVLHKLGQEKRAIKANPLPVTGIASTVVLTIILLVVHVPQKIAFAVSHAQFQELLNDLPEPAEDWGPFTINRQIGLYYVEDYEIDEHDRIFFRVHHSVEGFMPDVASYGFCHTVENDCLNPSDQIEYGMAGYKAHKVREGWYWFRVSDDW